MGVWGQVGERVREKVPAASLAQHHGSQQAYVARLEIAASCGEQKRSVVRG